MGNAPETHMRFRTDVNATENTCLLNVSAEPKWVNLPTVELAVDNLDGGYIAKVSGTGAVGQADSASGAILSAIDAWAELDHVVASEACGCSQCGDQVPEHL